MIFRHRLQAVVGYYKLDTISTKLFQILVCHLCVQWQRNLVFKHVVSIWIVGNVEAKFLVCSHHRQWFIVHISGYATLSHLLYHAIHLFTSPAQKTHQIQVPR